MQYQVQQTVYCHVVVIVFNLDIYYLEFKYHTVLLNSDQ